VRQIGDLIDRVEGDISCIDCRIAAPCSLSHAEFMCNTRQAAVTWHMLLLGHGLWYWTLFRLIAVLVLSSIWVIWRARYNNLTVTMLSSNHLQDGHSDFSVSAYLLIDVWL